MILQEYTVEELKLCVKEKLDHILVNVSGMTEILFRNKCKVSSVVSDEMHGGIVSK